MAQLQLLAALACVALASALPLTEPHFSLEEPQFSLEEPQFSLEEPQIDIQEPQIDIQEPQIDDEAAKGYLERYGYIQPGELTLYEDALSTFQGTFGLKKTGSLDEATIALMKTPRCGRSDNEDYRTKGQWSKKHITWRLVNLPTKGTLNRADIEAGIADGVGHWAAVSQLTFAKVSCRADINVTFKPKSHFGEHVLAHASYPGFNQDGKNHFNLAYTFTDDANGYNFEYTVTHELGHNLGMVHTSGSNVMNPYYPFNRGIPSADDRAGIQSIYGA